MKKLISLLIAILCFGFALHSLASAQDVYPEMEAGALTPGVAYLPVPLNDGLNEAKTEKVNFYAFKPVDEREKTDAGFPLLFFMHGIGERGDNVEVLKGFGPVKICNSPDGAKNWPFFLVAPQCPSSHFWSAAQMRVLLDAVCEKYPIDRERIYITGLSLGGFGTWSMLSTYPEIIAAAAPICGGGNPLDAAKMKDVPIWAFHGENDPLVPRDATINMFRALLKEGAKDVHITIYPRVGHDSWVKAYENRELYEWLLSKKLGKPNPSVPKTATDDYKDESLADDGVVPGEMARQTCAVPEVRRDREGKENATGGTSILRYWLFVPKNEAEKSEEGFPLLVFLHGSGERGTNLNDLKRYGPPQFLANPERAAEWRFLTVMPQCPARSNWSPAQIQALIKDVCEKHPVDPKRIYMTGVSMGGYGTWLFLKTYPDVLAAAAPICGGGDPQAASTFAKTPVWAFHGEEDPAVPCQRSIEMIEALKKAGNEDAHLTTYPGVGHNSWINAYNEAELYDWLLSKKLGESKPSVPKAANR